MKLLIKIGGSLLDSRTGRHAIARQLAQLARMHQLVAVHGGGKQLTRYLHERGVTSHFVRGLRVSDEPVIDAVTKVIAGSVNKHLVSAMIHAGCPAIGLSGADGPLTTAARLDARLGWVGKPVKTDGRLLDTLLAAGYTPVVACIAADSDGNIYNVNADQMAASCAGGWNASKLIFLTDVEGVKGENGKVLHKLSRNAMAHLISSGVAHGGMHAKLEAAGSALDYGISEVIIAGGHEPDICMRLISGEPVGTCVTAESLVTERSAI